MHAFDARTFARHGLTTAAFCCAIAAALTATGQGRWDVQLVYSLAIGLISWLTIDLGRRWLAPATNAGGWPRGWRWLLLVAAGVACGYVLGTLIGNRYSGETTAPWGHGPLPTPLAITVAAAVAISFYFYSRATRRQLQLDMARIERDAAEARLKLLETQLEPHMLFNTLANLRVLVASDPERTQLMLDHLIAYLRATLGASRATLHPLKDEFERLRDYLELIAVRMGPRLSYRLDLPDALRGAKVPPLLLQPLVENAIRHGLEPRVTGGSVQVSARTQAAPHGTLLALQVRNSGAPLAAPLPPAGAAPGRAFGLAQVRERLHTLYGAAATFELIADSAGHTCANITFPLQ